MARPAVLIALPSSEAGPVAAELSRAGLDPITVSPTADLAAVLGARRTIAVAVLDGETDPDAVLRTGALLHASGRPIPTLVIVSARTLDRLANGTAHGSIDDEYLTRPYSPEAIRWRVEAMCIRAQAVDDGSGPILQSSPIEAADWLPPATVIAVFNPKGGVGKTTIATNLAAALQVRRGQRVMLVDADTVTGHVTTSLSLDPARTVVDSWREAAEGGPAESLAEIAASHPSGLRVVALTGSPLDVEILEPARVVQAIGAARPAFDQIVVDLHPSYSPLNQALFRIADRILVPVTPDVPAIRAALQLRTVAEELGFRDRLALVVNRANSGVSVADIERTVGMPAVAQVRSAGMLFVQAANEGRTVIERSPKERVSADFDSLADLVAPAAPPAAGPAAAARPAIRFFARHRTASAHA